MFRFHLSIQRKYQLKRLRGAFIDNFFYTSVSRQRLSDFSFSAKSEDKNEMNVKRSFRRN